MKKALLFQSPVGTIISLCIRIIAVESYKPSGKRRIDVIMPLIQKIRNIQNIAEITGNIHCKEIYTLLGETPDFVSFKWKYNIPWVNFGKLVI